MKNKNKVLTIDDIKNELKKQYFELEVQKQMIKTIQQNERFEQTGDCEDDDFDYDEIFIPTWALEEAL